MISAEEGMSIQSLAVIVEHDLRREYSCDRFGIGGIANSDHIRYGGFYHCMAMVLVKYYQGDNVPIIDKFLDDNSFICNEKMDDLGFDKTEEIFNEYKKLLNNIKK